MNEIDYLLSIPTKKIKFGLKRTRNLLKISGNPEKNILSFQIIGTNGKGSVSAFLSKILQDQHYKVGLFTSPHLVEINERIRINNKLISNKEIKEFIKLFYRDIQSIQPSFFEIMTVMSMWYFNKHNVDFAIMETGLGGRLDSVTACQNKYLVFTSISKDHESILGKTLTKIALEKFGAILNDKQICFSTRQSPIVTKILLNKTKNNKTYYVHKSKRKQPTSIKKRNYMLGDHQTNNAELARLVIKTLQNKKRINIKNSISQSIQQTYWPARFQLLSQNPSVIYDVAHNASGINTFFKTFSKVSKKFHHKYLICAFENNKNINQSLNRLSKLFHFIVCTETNIRDSKPAREIKKCIQSPQKSKCVFDAKKALSQTIKKAKSNDVIVIIGTHFFAPHINNIFKNCFAIDK